MRRLVLASALAAAAAGVLYLVTPRQHALEIRSRILSERRTILEHLPPGYETSGRSYPVLLLLDASPRASAYGPSFHEIAGKLDSAGAPVPEMIVLGVTNTHRLRDMIPVPDTTLFPPAPGKADDFLRFLTEELIPDIDARYRTTGLRILYGGSDAGLFALYAMTAAPDAFQAVIASSPSLGRCPDFMAGRVRELFRERPALATRLFLVWGADEGASVAARVPELATLIERIRPESFAMGVRRVPDAGHVPESGLEDGLRFVFGGSAAKPEG